MNRNSQSSSLPFIAVILTVQALISSARPDFQDALLLQLLGTDVQDPIITAGLVLAAPDRRTWPVFSGQRPSAHGIVDLHRQEWCREGGVAAVIGPVEVSIILISVMVGSRCSGAEILLAELDITRSMARPLSAMNFFSCSSSSWLKPSSTLTGAGTGYSIFRVCLVSSEASRASTGLMRRIS